MSVRCCAQQNCLERRLKERFCFFIKTLINGHIISQKSSSVKAFLGYANTYLHDVFNKQTKK
jgi:hypothetical protein